MCANTSSSLLMKTMWHTETETAIRPGSRQAAARPPGRICYTSQQQSPLKTGTDGRYRIKPCWRGAASDAEVSPGRWREGEAGRAVEVRRRPRRLTKMSLVRSVKAALIAASALSYQHHPPARKYTFLYSHWTAVSLSSAGLHPSGTLGWNQLPRYYGNVRERAEAPVGAWSDGSRK